MSERRLEEVRQKLLEHRLQALIVTFLPNVYYLTGFTGSNAVLVITAENQVFLSDGRYRQQAQEEIKECQIVISSGSLLEAIKLKKGLPKKIRVGYESQYLTVAELRKLQRLFPRHTFVPTSSLVEEVSSVKDENEIARTREAARISDTVFQKILTILQDGVRESDVAAEISYLHRKFGAEADAFEPIVASGTRGSLPHARASSKCIESGEMVTLDFGCRYQGYHSDLTRTVSIGKPNPTMRKIYGIVQAAQQRAIDGARKGMKAKTLDNIARGHIRSKGFGRYFSHSLGHGLGHQVHELPRISRLSTDVLKHGNVVTIEPGIYIPKLGGVRIEDDIVIRNGGCEVMTTSPKDLIVL